MGIVKRAGAIVLAATLLITAVPAGSDAAKKSPKLSKSKITMKVGNKKTLKITGVKKVTWSTSKKKVVALASKTKTSVKLVAKSAGKAVVTAKAGKKKFKCNVTVSKATVVKATQTPGNAASTAEATAAAETSAPTEEPTPTPVPTVIPTPSITGNKWSYIPVDDESLLKLYEPIFGNVGTCLTYDGAWEKKEMQDEETMAFVRKNYNSFTLENEMKASYLLCDTTQGGWNAPFNQVLSVDDARAKGYYIPDGYNEADVPAINFEKIDKVLQCASENGIRMRGHTLVWHSQTPIEYFKVGYKSNNAFVTPEVMNERVKYYVINVMKHIYDGPYGDVLYAWDVVNEYFHQLSDNSTRNWSQVYNIVSGNNVLSTTPEFVKVAFKAAHDVLKEYDLEDKVSLFYNDYNESQVSDGTVALVNYVNAADELNPDGERICDGMGMQCHLGCRWPTVDEQLSTVKKYLDAGYEVQITELDITNDNGSTEAAHCDYWYDFMGGLVKFRLEDKPITGVTFWGLSDNVSWRRGQSPLLYNQSIKEPKKQLYAAYAAAQIWYLAQWDQ